MRKEKETTQPTCECCVEHRKVLGDLTWRRSMLAIVLIGFLALGVTLISNMTSDTNEPEELIGFVLTLVGLVWGFVSALISLATVRTHFLFEDETGLVHVHDEEPVLIKVFNEGSREYLIRITRAIPTNDVKVMAQLAKFFELPPGVLRIRGPIVKVTHEVLRGTGGGFLGDLSWEVKGCNLVADNDLFIRFQRCDERGGVEVSFDHVFRFFVLAKGRPGQVGSVENLLRLAMRSSMNHEAAEASREEAAKLRAACQALSQGFSDAVSVLVRGEERSQVCAKARDALVMAMANAATDLGDQSMFVSFGRALQKARGEIESAKAGRRGKRKKGTEPSPAS
ncbi:hypothetical protein HY375_01905 [Candidatus Berkelbacteria bacterium]|nr:hypothetical protein [Candidatus Berkelbacteria bacterium]